MTSERENHPPSDGESTQSNDEHIRSMFDNLDENQDGYICAEDIAKAFSSIGVDISTDDAEHMIHSADKDGDKRINYLEFVGVAAEVDTSVVNRKRFLNHWARKFARPVALEADVKNSSAAQSIWNTCKYLFAGAIAGAVSRTVASPFERTKILFQVQDLGYDGNRPTDRPKYRSIYQTLLRIGKEEGARGYFKGNLTNVVRIIPYSAVQYASYSFFKDVILDMSEQTEVKTWMRLSAGAMAGMTSVIASYPLDLIRCRLTAQSTVVKYSGILNAAKVIVAEEGVRGLYKGLGATLVGIAPYVGMNFTAYETLKHLWDAEGRELSVPTRLTLGAVAGSVAQTLTYPFDVTRRRMQMEGFVSNKTLKPYRHMGDAMKDIYRNHGWKGFYKGLLSNYLKVVPVVSVSFVVYEHAKEVLGLGDAKGAL